MDINVILWVVQIVLALVFLGAGYTHITQRDKPRKGMEWMQAVPAPEHPVQPRPRRSGALRGVRTFVLAPIT
jgi:hypothetical protein